MCASIRSAMERRIDAERWTIIDHDPIGYALSYHADVHASDQASVLVEKINVRPAQTLGIRTALLSVRTTRSTMSGSVREIFPTGRSLWMVVENPWVSTIVCFEGRSTDSGAV